MEDIGPIAERDIPLHPDADLPKEIEVISADNHWEITEDIFYENFPEHLKERAPRVWFDGFWRIGTPGAKQAMNLDKTGERAVRVGVLQDAWSHDVRIEHLSAEGVTKEIVFPQSLWGYREPDPEIRELVFRIYNEYMASQSRTNPNFFGVGIFSNWWDHARVQDAMSQIVSLGLKSFMMPWQLTGRDNKEMSFADPSMDRFWAVANEARIPVCFHVGEVIRTDGRGQYATVILLNLAPFRKPISQMVFGGVFDRYPKLQVVFAEGGLSWVAPWLQDAEMLHDSHATLFDPIDHRPSYYWHQNCYATFQTDDLGLSRLDILGADRVMWGADYPHSEGTFGYSSKVIRAIYDTVGKENAKLILGGNAQKIFGI
jgi:predicted TIM-barrel fold metal-dependent hydrolase